MEKRNGLFTPDEQNFLAEVLDNIFLFKNPLLEKMDKVIFKNLIKVIDDYGLDRIPETWKLGLIPLIRAAIAGEKEKVRQLTVDLLNRKIDVPKLDDYQELMVLDALSKFVATAIDLYIQKKSNYRVFS